MLLGSLPCWPCCHAAYHIVAQLARLLGSLPCWTCCRAACRFIVQIRRTVGWSSWQLTYLVVQAVYGRWQFEFGAACPTSNLYSLLTPPPGSHSGLRARLPRMRRSRSSHALLIYARLVHITHLRSLVGAGRTQVLAEPMEEPPWESTKLRRVPIYSYVQQAGGSTPAAPA